MVYRIHNASIYPNPARTLFLSPSLADLWCCCRALSPKHCFYIVPLVRMARSNVVIVVHWNGEILAHDNNPKYVSGRKKLSGIPVDITFTEFERKIYRLTDTPRDEYRLTIKVRYSTGMNQFDVVEVTDNDSLCGAIALSGNPPC
uniref:Uncharacterized protein n=1 Tax=Ananas comosus var. bracteatus TaxID=296719 RepID=A0A6V7PYA0_ANACO|nr:unnamed protein product [Ananas comosus var. bracteatus]